MSISRMLDDSFDIALKHYRDIQALTNPMNGSEDVSAAIQQLQKMPKTNTYLQEYSLASCMVEKLNLDNTEHRHFLEIARSTPEQQYKFDLKDITARLEMESRSHTGHKNYLNDMGLFYKGSGLICSAADQGVDVAMKFKVMPPLAGYTTKAALKSAKWYLDHKTEAFNNKLTFTGFHRKDIVERFNYFKEKPNELQNLINNKNILFAPGDLKNDFFKHLKNTGFDNLDEQLLQEKFYTALSGKFLGRTSRERTSPSHIQRKMDQYINSNPVLNRYVASLTVLEAKQRHAEGIQNAKQAFHFIGALGEQTKCEDLRRIAVVGSAAMDIYAGYSALQGVTSALGPLSVVGSAVPVVGAILQIGTSILQIVNMFKKKRSDNTESPVLKRLDVIISQIYNMHMEMRDSFQHVFANQQRIYQAITDGVHYLDTLVHTEVRNLRDYMEDKFTRLDQSIHHLSCQLNIGVNELHLIGFRRVLEKSSAVLEGRRRVGISRLIEEIDEELLGWIAGTDEVLPGSSNKFHTGAVWIESEDKESVRKIMAGLNEDKLTQLLGYLARYAEVHLNIHWRDGEGARLNTAKIFNPIIWCEGVGRYLEFIKAFGNRINCIGLSTERIIEAGMNTIHFIERIPRSPELFQQLFDHYQAALNTIVVLVRNALEEKNKEVNKKIVVAPLTCQYCKYCKRSFKNG